MLDDSSTRSSTPIDPVKIDSLIFLFAFEWFDKSNNAIYSVESTGTLGKHDNQISDAHRDVLLPTQWVVLIYIKALFRLARDSTWFHVCEPRFFFRHLRPLTSWTWAVI